ncbi:MAG TPA: hypothetical protein VGO93_23175 [Candidatus Xenobia bacterium]|jgi:serine/threonine protein kinase
MNVDVGTVIADRYEMDIVHPWTPAMVAGSAADRKTGKRVGVHLFVSDASASPKWREAFLLGGQALRAVPDLGQPRVLEAFFSDHSGVLVTDWLEGGPLLVEGEMHDPATVVAWATDVATLLSQLHARPAPVFGRNSRHEVLWRKTNGMATLLRYGVPEPPAGTSFTKGVSPYQAPETFGNSPRLAAVAADTYWLGAVMLLALTGKPPTSGLDRAAKNVTLQRPAGVSDAFWKLVNSMVAVKPTDRPSADDIQRRLQRL